MNVYIYSYVRCIYIIKNIYIYIYKCFHINAWCVCASVDGCGYASLHVHECEGASMERKHEVLASKEAYVHVSSRVRVSVCT